MIIRGIELTNFRPYRDASAEFPRDGGHIHVIEGPQGAGKTSLQHAIQWAFYGASGPTANYRTNWNEDARRQSDEEMAVKVKFDEGGVTRSLVREIDRFDDQREKAYESLSVFGDDVLEGDEAQEYIYSILPEQLRDFFFLDGERIQELAEEETGRRVRREIETVLKHKAIINAEEDLDDLVSSRFESRRRKVEEEQDDRDELTREIRGFRERKRSLEDDLEEAREEYRNKGDEIKQVREELERYDEESMERLKEVEEDQGGINRELQLLRQKLREAWRELPVGIVTGALSAAIAELESREKELESALDEVGEDEAIERLRSQIDETGKCPVCQTDGLEGFTSAPERTSDGRKRSELRKKWVQAQQLLKTLQDASEAGRSPADLEEQISDREGDLEDLKEERKELLNELGGRIKDGERTDLESSLQELEDERRSLKKDTIDDLQKEIDDLQRRIDDKEDERATKAGNKRLNEITSKIRIAVEVQDILQTVRTEHIKLKRDKIRTEMNEVFEQVQRSEFIRERYQGIDFKGAPGEEDGFVLELVRHDGRRKDMRNHPPSAGETQLTALSFIFGLNKYAQYGATVVFDTVAGRLDLENGKAQGEFFTTLASPIILLVTDAELRKLGKEMKKYVGTHHRLVADESINPTLQRVD